MKSLKWGYWYQGLALNMTIRLLYSQANLPVLWQGTQTRDTGSSYGRSSSPYMCAKKKRRKPRDNGMGVFGSVYELGETIQYVAAETCNRQFARISPVDKRDVMTETWLIKLFSRHRETTYPRELETLSVVLLFDENQLLRVWNI